MNLRSRRAGGSRRPRLTRLLGVGITAFVLAGLISVNPAFAADPWDPYGEGLQNSNKDLPYPTFVNAASAVPGNGVAFNPATSYLASVFAADLAKGAGTAPGNDFWIDKMLSRDGVQPDEAGGLDFVSNAPQNIDYDNNTVLFTKGRSLYMEDNTPGLGFRGDVAYIDSLGGKSAYTVDVRVGTTTIALTEDTTKRHNAPSYWYSEFRGGGLLVKQTKFITEQNVAAEWLQITTTDGTAKSVELVAASPFATTAAGTGELTGAVSAPYNVTSVSPRLSGDSFTVSGTTLTRTVSATSATTNVKLQMGFLTSEITRTTTQYQTIRSQTPNVAFTDQTRTYNEWWADNIPFVQTPEGVIDKSVFYRWWLLRTNFLDAAIPGNDYQFPTSIEGIFGRAYNNAIVLTAGMFIDDLKYFRDPTASYGTWLAAGEVARSSRYIDNPGNPANWSSSYANYISDAAWRAYELHGGDSAIATKLAHNAESDVKGQLSAFDTNKNNVIEYTNPAMTGNDLDAVSFSYKHTGTWGSYSMDRPETAYVYAGAKASAQAYRVAGDTVAADRMEAQAAAIKAGVISTLWENKRTSPDEMGLYGNLLKAAYSDNSSGLPAGYQVPWKEINTYYPYSVGLMPKPGDADFDQKYLDAFRLFVDQRQYAPFPFYTANQADAKARASRDTDREFFNNFSTINSTVIFRLLSSALRDYPNSYLTSDYYKKLLYWNAWAIYEKGDVTRQNENEFWSHGSAADGGSIKYRSWIHQTQLGTTNFTMIEDVAGLRSRTDNVLELSPIDIGWDHFVINNVKYHDQDLSIVWDKPGGGVDYYPTAPEGYSAYIGGKLAFTIDALTPVTFNTATGEIITTAAVVSKTAQTVQSARDVRFANDARIVDLLAKAGVDVDTRTSAATDLAAGAQVSASYSTGGKTGAGNTYAPQGAVDGTTANEPFWGTAGSPNTSDWLQIDLGATKTVDEARVYFYKSSTSGTISGYSPPAQYTVQYWDGTAWVSVTDQLRGPQQPTGNYNRVQFKEVSTTKLRVLVTHRAGSRTGIKEVQIRDTGATYTPADNQAPVVAVNRDTTYTQPGQARFIGSVTDDGLPAGALTQAWSVTSTPTADAKVTFTDAASVNTIAAFSKPGAYKLTFTVSDGDLTTTVVQDVTVSDEIPAGLDFSAAATPTVSYTPTWNRPAALNDGRIDPGGDQALLWGSYRNSGRPASDTVTYTWAAPTRVSSAQAYFWNDTAQDSGNGVALPSSWKLEYVDQFGQWQPVQASTAYPVVAMSGTIPKPSRVAFAPVITTQIRATFNASPNAAKTSYSALALSELDVLGENPTSVESVAVKTAQGQAAALPGIVTAVYADGTRGQVSAEWNPIDLAKYDALGRFTATGVITGSAFALEATVSVSQAGNDVGSVEPQNASTLVNKAPSLPRTAVVNLTGGNGGLESRAVSWPRVDPAAYSKPGTFDVQGTVVGTPVPVVVTVTVTSNPAGDVPAAPAAFAVAAHGTGAQLSWTAPATSTGSAVTGYEITVVKSSGEVISRQTAAPGQTVVNLANLAVDEYSTFGRAQSAAGPSDTVSIAFAILSSVASPTVTVTPSSPSGTNGWYTSSPTLTAMGIPDEVNRRATATASITAGQNRLSGLSDGSVFYTGAYPNSNNDQSQLKIWGTYTSSNRAATQTVQYSWLTPKVISSTTVHFWADQPAAGAGDGVSVPAGWKAQYRKTDGTWVDVEPSSPFSVNRASANTVNFKPVTTTALRLVMNADTNGSTYAAVGISEWQVPAIESSDIVQVRVNNGSWQTVGAGVQIATEGSLSVATRSLTANGIVSAEVVTAIKLDTTKPADVTFVGGPQGSVVEGAVPPAPTCTATDSGSGVAKCEVTGYSTDVGTHTLTAIATDKAGLSATSSRDYTVTPKDSTAPTLTVSVSPAQPTGSNGWWISPVTITASATDNDTAAPLIQVSRDAGVSWDTYAPLQFGEGTHDAWLRAVDAQGNASEISKQRILVDSVVPQATTSIDLSGRKVVVVGTDPDPGSDVASIQYRIDGGAWTSTAGSSAVVQVGTGPAAVEYRAVDNAGNTGLTGTANVPAASSPAPKATVKVSSPAAPTDDGWYNTDVIVAITAPAGYTAQYRLDAGAWKAATKSVTVSTSGAHVLDHRLLKSNVPVDRSTDSISVKLDRVTPVASVVRTTAAGAGTPRNPITVSFDATDSVSGVAKIEYRINQGQWTEIAAVAPVTINTVGDSVVSYRATDTAGNVSTAKSTTVKIVVNPVTAVKVSATTVKPGGYLTYTMTGYDRFDTLTLTMGNTVLATVFTDVNGTAKITMVVPANTPAGATTVTVKGSDGDPNATVKFTVKP